MADAKITADGDASKIIKELRKARTEIDRLGGKLVKINSASKRTARNTGKMVTAFKQLAGAYVGIAALRTVVADVSKSFQEARRETLGFEDELTDLLSLGENVGNISKIKDEVLAFSGAWGIARASVIDSMFDIQSGASSLSKEMREGIRKEVLEIAKVTKTDLPSATKLMVKTWNIYGDSLKNANQLQNKLFKTAELGFLNFKEMSENLADVVSPAKALGYSLDDVLAALVTATQKGGKTQKTFTGLRNVFIRMDKAVKEGLTTNKDFMAQLNDLSSIDPKIVSRIFGAETIAVINNLVSSTTEFAGALNTVKTVTGDIVQSKLWKRMEDTAYFFSESIKLFQQMQKNVPLTKDYAETVGPAEMKYQQAKLGFRAMTPTFLHGSFIEKFITSMTATGEMTGLEYGGGRAFVQRGQQEYLNQLAGGGRGDEAVYHHLKFQGREEEAEKFRKVMEDGAEKINQAADNLLAATKPKMVRNHPGN